MGVSARPDTEGFDYHNLVIPGLPPECPPFLRDLSVIVVEPVVLVYRGGLGYCVPGLLPELGLGKGPGGGQLTPEQLAARARVKQLPPGAAFAPQRQQAMAAVGVGAGYE
ncbi:hypothetical protein ES708_28529 [subsurface metagenome]